MLLTRVTKFIGSVSPQSAYSTRSASAASTVTPYSPNLFGRRETTVPAGMPAPETRSVPVRVMHPGFTFATADARAARLRANPVHRQPLLSMHSDERTRAMEVRSVGRQPALQTLCIGHRQHGCNFDGLQAQVNGVGGAMCECTTWHWGKGRRRRGGSHHESGRGEGEKESEGRGAHLRSESKSD